MRGGLLLLLGAVDPIDDQPLRGLVGGERGDRQVGHVGIDTRAPPGRDHGPAIPSARRLIPLPVDEQMRVKAPAAGGFAVTHPHQVDLVPDVRVGQEMRQVWPLPRPGWQPHRQDEIPGG
jgi:hypothetical protein